MLLSQFQTKHIEAGCDEAGRGCLAGPVVAAAVIFPVDYCHPSLNDSKKLTSKQREGLVEIIKKESMHWAIGEVSHTEIDEINILNASFLAMHRAIEALGKTPEHLIIDGNRFNEYNEIPYTCIVKGDSKFLSIAAASILAKTHRDKVMTALGEEYPEYGWETNMGYPTKKHRSAISEHGITPYHRKSFQLLPRQLEIF